MNLYKYLHKKDCLEFKEKGIIHLSTLESLRLFKKQGIGDKSEGVQTIVMGKQKPIAFSGVGAITPTFFVNKGSTAHFQNVSFTSMLDGYVFCSTTERNDNYWGEKFGYDAHYVIKNPCLFTHTLRKKIGVPKCRTFQGLVHYTDDRDVTVEEENKTSFLKNNSYIDLSPCFKKEAIFSQQREYRMLFISSDHIDKKKISCPKLTKLCSFE